MLAEDLLDLESVGGCIVGQVPYLPLRTLSVCS